MVRNYPKKGFKKSFPHACTYEDFDHWKIQTVQNYPKKGFQKAIPHARTYEDFDHWKIQMV